MSVLWATFVISFAFLGNVSSAEECESKWRRFSGYWYKRFCNATFEEAEKTCMKNYGHLVSIHSEKEDQFVRFELWDIHMYLTFLPIS
ncbi:hypothetical protein Aduo_013541 [Ancylostoma duodenale]